MKPRPEETKSIPVAPQTIGDVLRLRICDLRKRGCWLLCLGYAVVVTTAFIKPLYSLAVHSATTGLDSYILLVPFISAYLIHIKHKPLPGEYFSSPGFAIISLVAGLAALAAPWSVGEWGWPLSHNDFPRLWPWPLSVSWQPVGSFSWAANGWRPLLSRSPF
jgi:hypothetical protein